MQVLPQGALSGKTASDEFLAEPSGEHEARGPSFMCRFQSSDMTTRPSRFHLRCKVSPNVAENEDDKAADDESVDSWEASAFRNFCQKGLCSRKQLFLQVRISGR